jgi:hypothetical protein
VSAYEADKEADKASEYEPTGYNIKNGKVTIIDFSKAFDLPKSNAPIRDNAQPPKFFDPNMKLKPKPKPLWGYENMDMGPGSIREYLGENYAPSTTPAVNPKLKTPTFRMPPIFRMPQLLPI